jgi:hypothetical protein
MPDKGLASLSSSLLARKGQARPAMRSQGFAGFSSTSLEDLGWNDMGTAEPFRGPATVLPIQPPEPVVDTPARAVDPAVDTFEGEIPPVLLQREALNASLTIPPPVKSVSVATAQRLKRETAHAGKAAFTLRVDAERHLKLRIASAITNRSSQDLVTEALDALVGAIAEVEALVAQLPRTKARKG